MVRLTCDRWPSSLSSRSQLGQWAMWSRSSELAASCSPRATRARTSGFVCIRNHLHSVPELDEATADVALDGAWRHRQPLGDLGVGQVLEEREPEDLLGNGVQPGDLLGDRELLGDVDGKTVGGDGVAGHLGLDPAL